MEHLEDGATDSRTTQQTRFLAQILMSALAPTNTVLGNPEAVKKAFDTGGASLVQGTRNMARDLLHNGGMPS